GRQVKCIDNLYVLDFIFVLFKYFIELGGKRGRRPDRRSVHVFKRIHSLLAAGGKRKTRECGLLSWSVVKIKCTEVAEHFITAGGDDHIGKKWRCEAASAAPDNVTVCLGIQIVPVFFQPGFKE